MGEDQASNGPDATAASAQSAGGSVSGLLVTPRGGIALDALRAAVASVPGCEPGAFAHGRLVVVAAADTVEEGRLALRRLEGLPGVAAVDVVFVSVETPQTAPGGATWS